MTRRLALVLGLALAAAAPAPSFWGAFFAGIGKAVGKAIGFGGGSLPAAGLMPVTVKGAEPLLNAAQDRLNQLQQVNAGVQDALAYYRGTVGTLGDLSGLDRFRAPASPWLRSATADRHGTSGPWIRVLNGASAAGRAADAYGRAAAPVPDWTGALGTLPNALRGGVRREHATLELADAAAVRAMAVLGEVRRAAPDARRAADALEQAALDPRADAHALPALLGKVSVGQTLAVRQVDRTNQLLDALVETDLAARKRDRDRLARSMQAAAAYRALAAAQPLPQWRMP